MFGLSTIEGALATAARDIVVGAKAVATFAADSAVPVAEATIESITTILDPKAVKYEQAAFDALGLLAKSALTIEAAAGDDFVNIPLDIAAFNAVKAIALEIVADLKAKAGTAQAAMIAAKAAA